MKVLNGKISGGYKFKQFKGQPSSGLAVLELPDNLVVPVGKVKSGIKPLVNRGDSVEAGQIIWQDDEGISSPIHSPVNGIVDAIQKKDSPGGQIRVIKISATKSDKIKRVPGYTSDWKKLTNKELEKVIYLSGVGVLGSGGVPTEFRTSIISPQDVEHVLVHATDAEIYNADISLFLEEDGAKKFSEGLSILSRIMDKAVVHVAMSTNTDTWFQVIDNAALDNLSVLYHKTQPKYPQNHDSVLLKSVLGIDLPAGFKGVNKGVVILGIQDVCQIYEAVVEGQPLIERVVSLGGPVFTENIHISLKIGTLLSDVVKGRLLIEDEEDVRFIKNSVLSGDTISLESSIERDMEVLIALEEKRGQDLMFFAKPGFKKDSYSNTFLAKVVPFKKTINTNINGEHRACLSCGFCQNVCPVGILPNVLFPYAERDRLDETAVQYGIFKCIDCNICTYVCTAKIPIAAYLKEGKKKLIEDAYVKEDDFITSYNLIGVKRKEQINEAAE